MTGVSESVLPLGRVHLIGRAGAISVLLDQRVTLIGRSPDCEIVVTEPLASRRHASIVREQHGYIVADLGSRNGTLINSSPLTGEHLLRHADTIQVATTVLRFEDPNVTIASGALQPGARLPVWVNEATGEAFVRGHVLELAPKELSLLSLLCAQAGTICSRNEIASVVWPEYHGQIGDNNIETLVRRLRQRLVDAGASANIIMTVKKRGYRVNFDSRSEAEYLG